MNTSYTVDHIYDYDIGLTPSMMRHIVEGVYERQNEEFLRQMQLWMSISPMLAASVNYGFSGHPDALTHTVSSTRAAITKAKTKFKGGDAKEQTQKKPKSDIPEAISHHPLFIKNFGKPLM